MSKARDNLLPFWPSCWPAQFTFRFRWTSPPPGARKSTLTPASGWCSFASTTPASGQTRYPSLPGSRPTGEADRQPGGTRLTQPAYIIYTSGSTGTPGVVISAPELNTCYDINSRYQVGPGDRMLALSALHFDLSVYDIFGVLSAGGALVMVMENQRRDPHAWCELINAIMSRSGTASRRCSICC